jgi:hypothetical protein
MRFTYRPLPTKILQTRTFLVCQVAPTAIMALCMSTTVTGCQAHTVEGPTEEVLSVQIAESASSPALLWWAWQWQTRQAAARKPLIVEGHDRVVPFNSQIR